MKRIEAATRAELRSMGVKLRESALGRSAVDLARRLDGEPADRVAVELSRELRMVVRQLHDRHDGKGGGPDEVEAFLARIAATDGGDAAD